MEKRRRRKTRTLAQFLRRYFLTTAFGVLAILAAAVLLFMAGLNAGFYTSADHNEKQAQELIGKIQRQDFFDPAEVPDGIHYLLFSHEQLADSSLPEDSGLADFSLYTGSYTGRIGAETWFRTDLRAEVVILLFRYEVRPTAPGIAALISDLQGLFISVTAVLLLLYLWMTTNRYGTKLVQALNALEESATQIASGNLDFTLHDTPLTEFNQALDSVDTMRSALKDSLVQQWDMQNQREIQIAALAHDLKTPLAVIQGNVELLQEEALSETAGESLEAIQRRLGQLSQYVLQLQQAACSQNQAEQPKVTPIHELIRRCTEEVSGLCRNKEITLTVFCPPFSARVHTETLRRALINLLDNAIRYCPPGKTVQLMGAVTETNWILKVSDEGPGFQAESLKHIGEPFYRYESARSSNGHAGLGLYTVSQAMQIEGGRMIPGNVPDGSGAQVILEFPLSSLADDSKTASAPDLKYPLEDQN